MADLRPAPRPSRLRGVTERVETPLGPAYLTLNFQDGAPFELFAQVGKAGSDVRAFTEAVARMVSLALRSGVDPEEVAGQLLGMGGSRPSNGKARSVPDAIGRFIRSFLEGGAPLPEPPPSAPPPPGFDICPECGSASLISAEGCSKCLSCGFSFC